MKRGTKWAAYGALFVAVFGVVATSVVAPAAFAAKASGASSMNGHGLLTVSCTNDNAVLELLSPTTGAELDQLSVPQLTEAAPGRLFVQAGCPIITSSRVPVDAVGGLYAREQFNANFSEVTWSTFTLDDLDHVGYMDVDGGNIVDVTALTESTGFGAVAPDDLSPVFNPTNGKFYFLSEGPGTESYNRFFTVHVYNTITHTQQSLGRVLSSLNDPTLTIQDGVAVVDDLLISPNGRLAAYSDTGGNPFYAVKRPTCCGALVSSFQYCPGGSCYGVESVYGWIGNSTVLVDGGTNTSAGFSRARVFASGHHLAAVVPLLPSNPDVLSDAVLSPDGTQMVFEGAVNGTTGLYVTSSVSVHHPKTLIADYTGMVIAWQ